MEKQLRTLFHEPQLREEMQNHRIEWCFNLERAPWWGGFFKRMVGCVKRCLKKVLGNARLTYDELLTVLTEEEATLNSRPLMAVVESVIVGKDKEVRGANVRVIMKGKAVHLSRPVQKLFPIEIRTGTSKISDVPK